MEAIILAAGYSTRLYPLTENMPKSLLDVAGKPIIEHIIKKLEMIADLDTIHIITNDKFEQHFSKWLKSFDSTKKIEIINDKTKGNEERLGALGDINFAINKKNIDNDLIVVAGDNLFEMPLTDMFNFFKKKKSNIIALHDVKNIELAKHYGIVEAENNLVVNFEEKPHNPKSTLASTGIYIFPKKTIELIKKYISQGNDADKTGSFIEWLYKRDKVYSYVTEKKWYDIGTVEQLEKANRHYKEK